MNEVLPFVFSEEKFKSRSEFWRTEKKMARFAKTTHSLSQKQAKKILGDDPYALAMLSQLKDLVTRAHTSFRNRDFNHSRTLFKASVSSCFNCHTRTQFGPDTYYWKNFNVSDLEADQLEKAQLYIALRQFSNAKNSIQSYLLSKEKQNSYNSTAYENGVKLFLTVALRGQESIDEAQKFISQKLRVGLFSMQLEHLLTAWQKDLIYWKKNRQKLQPQLKSIRSLLGRSHRNFPQSILNDESLVKNLLASSLLHKTLMGKVNKKQKAEAYYYLGNIYNSIIISGFWDLPETYFEMCIRYVPKSKLAKKCYKEYRSNIVLGYSGSRGTVIPHFEYEKMEKLRHLAGVK